MYILYFYGVTLYRHVHILYINFIQVLSVTLYCALSVYYHNNSSKDVNVFLQIVVDYTIIKIRIHTPNQIRRKYITGNNNNYKCNINRLHYIIFQCK